MFTHLHVHTEYSMIDGLSRIEDLVLRTKELGMDSLAMTDHGGLYGAIDFYKTAKKHDIKPIIGCEVYVAPDSRHERSSNNRSPYHMTVLSQNERGYHNLLKLVSKSNLEGFYYKPRIDRELLEQHSEGLIVLSGCPSGEVPRALTDGDMERALDTAAWYKELLDGRYFLELMSHNDVPELPQINKGLMELHRQLDIPIAATNDSHYTHQHDAPLQDILICIQTNTNVADAGRLRMAEDSYYLRSPEEMAELFKELPDAISNTQRIAEMCELNLDFSQMRLPEYPVPDGLTADEYLAKICYEGLAARIPNAGEAEHERLAYELEVIRQTQFPDYFLVVWDIAKFVHRRDIFFAVRGSAAASLVLYCLGVTDVNPLPYRLVFERFLNVERKEMPDIDMDFQDDRREEVINYVVDKYGKEHVAQIITFGTFGAKGGVRDVARALAMPYSDGDRVAKLVPNRLNITLKDALQQSAELKEIYDTDEDVTKLVDTAMGLEGLTRHAGTHAAAVLISQEPLDEIVPLQRPARSADDGSGVAVTQYSMDPCADLGLLKMDFLGLTNLTILANARDLIAETRGINFSLTEIPLNDGATFDLLSRGETVGVFQLEGDGMTRYIKELKPSALSDVAAMIALYRPGPMDHISTFIDSKHGRAVPHYPHPALKDILEETYGVIVYQDQVLQIARTFAGYSLGQADIVRKAMGKKIPAIMAEEKQNFLKGALEQGYTQAMAEEIFALIEPFAGYAFNKAHSVSYGLISYWTAYLKANFPIEYMAALLNSSKDSSDKIASVVAECRRMGVSVLPPSINKSEVNYSIDADADGKDAIRWGLSAIKGVGEGAVSPLVADRKENGAFSSIEDLCQSVDLGRVGKKALESLIRAGALDEFGDRTGMEEVLERIISLSKSEAGMRNSQQTSMFDMMGDSMPAELASIDIPNRHTTDVEKSQWEREFLGVSTSNNALFQMLTQRAGSSDIVAIEDLKSIAAGRRVKITGIVSSVNRRETRKGQPFAIVSLSLLDGEQEVFVWEDELKETAHLWKDGKLVSVTGNVRHRDDNISVSCAEAHEIVLPETAASTATGAENEGVAKNGAANNGIAENGTANSVAPVNGASVSEANGNGASSNGMSANDSAGKDAAHIGANGNGAFANGASDYGAPADTTAGETEPEAQAAANGATSLPQTPLPAYDATPNDLPESAPSAQPASPTVSETNGTYGESAPSSELDDAPDDAPPWDEPAPPNGINEISETNGAGGATNGTNVTNGANGTNGYTPQNGNGATDGNGTSGLPSRPVDAGAQPSVEAAQRLLLRLIEGEPEHDRRMLQILSSILMDYQGECEVTLEITTAGHIVEMDWPAVRVHANDELIARLNTEALGAAGEARLVEKEQ